MTVFRTLFGSTDAGSSLAPLLVGLAVAGSLAGGALARLDVSTTTGLSMAPTLDFHAQLLTVRLDPDRGDLYVFRTRDSDGEWERAVKRIVGVPGDTLARRAGLLFVNGQPRAEPYISANPYGNPGWGPVVVGPGAYFLLGDNRDASSDSRDFGAIREEQLVGEVVAIRQMERARSLEDLFERDAEGLVWEGWQLEGGESPRRWMGCPRSVN